MDNTFVKRWITPFSNIENTFIKRWKYLYQTLDRTSIKRYFQIPISFISEWQLLFLWIDMSIADMLSQFGGRCVVDRNNFDHSLKYYTTARYKLLWSCGRNFLKTKIFGNIISIVAFHLMKLLLNPKRSLGFSVWCSSEDTDWKAMWDTTNTIIKFFATTQTLTKVFVQYSRCIFIYNIKLCHYKPNCFIIY